MQVDVLDLTFVPEVCFSDDTEAKNAEQEAIECYTDSMAEVNALEAQYEEAMVTFKKAKAHLNKVRVARGFVKPTDNTGKKPSQSALIAL